MGGKSFAEIQARVKGETPPVQPAALSTPPQAADLNPDRVLAMISELSALIEQSTDIGETVALRDRAQALQYLSRKAELETEIKNRATIAVINAKRKIGELTMAIPQNEPFSHSDKMGKTEYLEQYGLSLSEVYRNETLAKLDHRRLSLFIDKKLSDGYEITIGAAMKYAENATKPRPTPGGGGTPATPTTEPAPAPEVGAIERVMDFEIPDAISWLDEYYDFARNVLPDDVQAGQRWTITARRVS